MKTDNSVYSFEKDFVPYEQAKELKELEFDEPCFTFYPNPKEDKMGFNGKYHSIREGYKNSTVNALWIKRYNKDFKCVTTPTYSQAFRWFREKHGLYSSIVPKKSYPDKYVSGIEWNVVICGGDGIEIGPDGTYTYAEAELACLKKLIELVKK